jgi:hypothetical protein
MPILLMRDISKIRVTDRPMTRQGLGIATGAKGMTPVVVREVISVRNYVGGIHYFDNTSNFVCQNRP